MSPCSRYNISHCSTTNIEQIAPSSLDQKSVTATKKYLTHQQDIRTLPEPRSKDHRVSSLLQIPSNYNMCSLSSVVSSSNDSCVHPAADSKLIIIIPLVVAEVVTYFSSDSTLLEIQGDRLLRTFLVVEIVPICTKCEAMHTLATSSNCVDACDG